MSIKRIQRELIMFTKNPPAGVTVSCPDEANQRSWNATLAGPEGSPYEGGIWDLTINFPDQYPMRAPEVRFETRVYHPNIGEDGEICLDILSDQWSPALTIAKVLLSISSLLTDPNPNDPLVPEIAQLYLRDRSKHDATAREWVAKYAT